MRRLIAFVLLVILVFASVALAGSRKPQRLTLTTKLPALPRPSAKAPKVPFAENPRLELRELVDMQERSRCQSQDPGNPYAAPTSSVDAITHDAVNVGEGSNHGCVTPQNEPSIAVSPINPANVVIASNDYRMCCDALLHNDGGGMVYASFDGGQSFTQTLSPGFTSTTGGSDFWSFVDSAGDPSLAFGPDGTLYYTNIAFSREGSVSGVGISVSEDGGRSWARPHLIVGVNDPSIFIDKEWVTVGPGGTIYVTFTVFLMDIFGHYQASPIVLASSKDVAKWKLRLLSRNHIYGQGSIPQVDPSGKLFVAYEAADMSFNYDVQVVSTRGRGKFVDREVGRVYDGSDCYPLNDDGRSVLTAENFRINSLPTFAIDPYTGRHVLAWADNEDCMPSETHNSVKVVFGNGRHYTRPYYTPAAGEKVLPAVAARAGEVAVGYYTRAYATDGESLDYAVSFLSDRFATETRLSEESSNPWLQFAGAFIGDYTGLAFGDGDGVLHAAWTDSRGSPGQTAPNQDVYTARLSP